MGTHRYFIWGLIVKVLEQPTHIYIVTHSPSGRMSGKCLDFSACPKAAYPPHTHKHTSTHTQAQKWQHKMFMLSLYIIRILSLSFTKKLPFSGVRLCIYKEYRGTYRAMCDSASRFKQSSPDAVVFIWAWQKRTHRVKSVFSLGHMRRAHPSPSRHCLPTRHSIKGLTLKWRVCEISFMFIMK